MFSTVSRFGQLSNSWRSSPGRSCGDGEGITNDTFGGSIRKQRRQLSVLVRYCTKPQTAQRSTSRSISVHASSVAFSPTGSPRRPTRECEEEGRSCLSGEGSDRRESDSV